MKDCTKRWPTNLLSLKMSFKSWSFKYWELESRQTCWIFCVYASSCFSKPQTESVLHSLAEISWFWKLTKISETGDEPQPSKKHRHEVPPKININFLTDAGKTKGALGFVVLAFLLPMFFLLEGLQYTLITSYTVYTHHLIHDWHSVFKGDWIYSRCVICGCPHIQWPLQKCFLFSPVVRGKIFERPMLTFPKDVF